MVSIGDKLEHVITRCGKPCASGGIPKGPCRLDPPLFKVELCSNECVIYQDVALCLVGDQVASIFQMTDGRYWTLQSCEWPNYSSPTQTR
ncbi:hypothetical protein MFUL124B02_02455 [Myxococcus fulvus 124B02]|nr:hypothetical protein MFUL124B02_02455 [Myxococcus fulvus 124B02]